LLPQPQHSSCSRGDEHPTKRREPPYAPHRGVCPQLRCVTLKRWQRLQCNGTFGPTYNSADTRKPQSSVIYRTFDTSGPRTTDTTKLWARGQSLVGSWSRRPERSSTTPGRQSPGGSSRLGAALNGRNSTARHPEHECPVPPTIRRSPAFHCPGSSPGVANSVKVWKLKTHHRGTAVR
jgi:hypothetical protein